MSRGKILILKGNILTIKGLSKHFGKLRAVDNISFNIKKGNVYGILGPNGSGKSTTLGMLLSVVNKTRGHFQWFDDAVNSPEKALKKIGAIIERPNFYPNMNAVQNLKLVCMIKGCPRHRIEENLKIVDLYERKKDAFKTYSLGMKQRLAIASALLNNPEVLILDEPTNGLDPQGIHQIRSLIQKIKQQGTTILLASHLLEEVEKVCSDVIILKNGQKIYESKVANMDNSKEKIEVGISGDHKELEAALVAHPDVEKTSLDGKLIIVSPLKRLDPSTLNRYLFEKGFTINHLKTRKSNLETAFLNLTS